MTVVYTRPAAIVPRFCTMCRPKCLGKQKRLSQVPKTPTGLQIFSFCGGAWDGDEPAVNGLEALLCCHVPFPRVVFKIQSGILDQPRWMFSLSSSILALGCWGWPLPQKKEHTHTSEAASDGAFWLGKPRSGSPSPLATRRGSLAVQPTAVVWLYDGYIASFSSRDNDKLLSSLPSVGGWCLETLATLR